MNSLKDVYNRLVEQEKTAAARAADPTSGMDEQSKLAMQRAADYEEVGRELARHAFREAIKEAAEHLPMGHGPGHRHEDGLPCGPHCEHHGKGAGHAEKKASIERAILDRMARDPEYVAELVARHRSR
jgi:hypothetical protein